MAAPYTWRSGSLLGDAHHSVRGFASWPEAFQHLLETVYADAQDARDGGDDVVIAGMDALEIELEDEVQEGASVSRTVGEFTYFIEAI